MSVIEVLDLFLVVNRISMWSRNDDKNYYSTTPIHTRNALTVYAH
jgi:hypothetical protein